MLADSINKLLPEGIKIRKVSDNKDIQQYDVVLDNGEFSSHIKLPYAYDMTLLKESVDKAINFFKVHAEKMANDKAERELFINSVKKVKQKLIENN